MYKKLSPASPRVLSPLVNILIININYLDCLDSYWTAWTAWTAWTDILRRKKNL